MIVLHGDVKDLLRKILQEEQEQTALLEKILNALVNPKPAVGTIRKQKLVFANPK